MSEEIEFREYLEMIKKYWIISLISIIIVLGAVLAYTFLGAPVYEAKSLVVINSQDQANFLLGSSAPKVTDIETQMIIIQSSTVMSPVYSKYADNKFDVGVSNIKNSNIIEISVKSDNPENSATIANDIASNYISYTTDARVQDAQSSIDFISEKIKAYDTEINTLNVKALYYENLGTKINQDEKAEYVNIQREITAKNKIYDYLLSKKEEASLTASIKNTNVNIISYAQVPLMPIKPNKPLNIALGIILALGAAFGTAMIANSISQDKKHKAK